MALKTLKGVKKIDGFKLNHINDHDFMEPTERRKNYIEIDHCFNEISFTIQNGPIKEVGVNGCQVDTLIETAKLMIEGLNKNYP